MFPAPVETPNVVERTSGRYVTGRVSVIGTVTAGEALAESAVWNSSVAATGTVWQRIQRSVWKNAPFLPSTRTPAGTTIEDDMPSKGPLCMPPVWAAAGRNEARRRSGKTRLTWRQKEIIGSSLVVFRY